MQKRNGARNPDSTPKSGGAQGAKLRGFGRIRHTLAGVIRERLSLSIMQRLGLAFVVITVLWAGTSVVGAWFANSAAQNLAQVQRGAAQTQAIERLQRDWYDLSSSVDLLLLTRSTANQAELVSKLEGFKVQLAVVVGLTQQGVNSDTRQETSSRAPVLQEMGQISSELDEIMNEILGLVQAGRWGSAQTLRYSRLAGLQLRLQENLQALNQAIQQDVQNSSAAAQRTQSVARGVWIATAFIVLLLSLGISWLSSRAIARPIRELTGEVKRITEAGRAAGGWQQAAIDQRAIIVPKRRDEIGDVWQAFATLTEWLSEATQNLEQRVAERTQALERRTIQVQVAAEVARDITGQRYTDSDQRSESGQQIKNLLDKAVNLIGQRFGFYYAAVFMVDERREFAVLRAATGEAGRQMIDDHHRLKVGEVGLVGFVAESGNPRIALDVGKDAVHFRNPRLPDTRSEVALPLRTRDEVIGVLDVQSQEASAFDEQDVIILQIIADQLATAIENTRLLNELEIRLQELESFYAGYGRQSWERIAQQEGLMGYEYDGEIIRPLRKEQLSAAVQDAAESARPRRFPIRLRDEIIAHLDIWAGEQGVSAEDEELIEMFTNRISQVLESARLFSETQQRAVREQLLNELTSTLVRSIDPQAVLTAAVRQLESLPSIARANVYLSVEHEKQPGPTGGANP